MVAAFPVQHHELVAKEVTSGCVLFLHCQLQAPAPKIPGEFCRPQPQVGNTQGLQRGHVQLGSQVSSAGFEQRFQETDDGVIGVVRRCLLGSGRQCLGAALPVHEAVRHQVVPAQQLGILDPGVVQRCGQLGVDPPTVVAEQDFVHGLGVHRMGQLKDLALWAHPAHDQCLVHEPAQRRGTAVGIQTRATGQHVKGQRCPCQREGVHQTPVGGREPADPAVRIVRDAQRDGGARRPAVGGIGPAFQERGQVRRQAGHSSDQFGIGGRELRPWSRARLSTASTLSRPSLRSNRVGLTAPGMGGTHFRADLPGG